MTSIDTGPSIETTGDGLPVRRAKLAASSGPRPSSTTTSISR